MTWSHEWVCVRRFWCDANVTVTCGCDEGSTFQSVAAEGVSQVRRSSCDLTDPLLKCEAAVKNAEVADVW